MVTTTETSFRPFPGRATTPSVTFDDGNRGSSELCGSDGKIDAIFTGPDNKAYVFKGLNCCIICIPEWPTFCVWLLTVMSIDVTGEKYWKLEAESVAPGYPRSIQADWEGLPGNINAAFTWTNGRTYFFKVFFFFKDTMQFIQADLKCWENKRDRDIGAIRISSWTLIIQKICPKDSLVCPPILTRLSYGAATAKFTSLKVYLIVKNKKYWILSFIFYVTTLLIDKNWALYRKSILAVRSTSEAAHQVDVPERHF